MKKKKQPALPPQRPLRKAMLFRAVAVVVGLAAGLVLAEVVLRVCRIQPERLAPRRCLAWDGAAFRECRDPGEGLIKRASRYEDAGVLMGEYIPGAVFKFAYASNPRGYFDRDNSVRMTVNSLGLRGEEVGARKPAGSCRILGIGDSFAFGEGVKDEDTALHRLQDRLNGKAPGQKRYEVLNAGVSGYNTSDEVIYLERRWLALEPDLVLIFFYINDAYDDSAMRNQGQELGLSFKQPSGLAQYSRLWDLVQHQYKTHRASKAVEAYYKENFFTDARNFLENPGREKVDWTVCRAALESARRNTRVRDIKLGLVMFPEFYHLKGGYPFEEIHQLVGETCGRLGIPFLDLLATFRGHDPKRLWVHPSDHHPNETAHALAAEAIERFVRKEFLPAEPSAAPVPTGSPPY